MRQYRRFFFGLRLSWITIGWVLILGVAHPASSQTPTKTLTKSELDRGREILKTVKEDIEKLYYDTRRAA